MKSLSDILSTFTAVRDDLTEFVQKRDESNKNLENKLALGESELKMGKSALKQVTKIVGK